MFLFCVSVFFLSCLFPILAVMYNPSRAGTELIFTWPCRFLGIRFFRVAGTNLVYPGERRILYLSNHRSFIDGFVDRVLTGMNGSYVSRWMIFFVFPLFSIISWMTRSIGFFYRGKDKVVNKERFYRLLDSYRGGILLYPEGRRNHEQKGLDLKPGALMYSWDRKVPIQLVISKGKENVTDEFSYKLRFGKKVTVYYSKELDPIRFEDYQTFRDRIQFEWNLAWDILHSKDLDPVPFQPYDLNELEPEFHLGLTLMQTGLWLIFIRYVYPSISIFRCLRAS